MRCITCGYDNAPLKKVCRECGAFLAGETINNVTGKWGRRNTDGSFTPYKEETHTAPADPGTLKGV